MNKSKLQFGLFFKLKKEMKILVKLDGRNEHMHMMALGAMWLVGRNAVA